MNKKIINCFYLLLVFSAALPVMAGGSREKAAQTASDEGLFAFISGDVLINGNDAVTGEKVLSGDIIETGTDSFCEITFSGRNVFRLMDNSSLIFGNQDFVLNNGAIALVTDRLKKITSRGDALSVRTSSAVAGIRGTVFFIKKEDENNTYVCICSGVINTYDTGGENSARDRSEHHKAMRITNINGRFKRSDAPLIYHDDALMEAVASRIGLDIGWSY